MAESDWVVINDFRSGIHQSLSPTHPLGACTADTFRCKASTTGALIPAPALVDTIHYPPPEGGTALESEEYRIGGLFCNDPVFTADNTVYGVDQNNSEIYMGLEWYVGGQWKRRVARYLIHRLTPEWQNISTKNEAADYDPNSRPKRCYFAVGRSNNNDPTQTGPTVVAWTYAKWARFFPDDTNTDVVANVALPGDSNVLVFTDTMIGHQGRIVVFPLTITQVADASGEPIVFTTNENIYWTEVNDWRTLDGSLTGFFQVLAGYENPTGYGVVASMTADELLLIKARGGGMFIRGSLNDFSATTLPNVRSTGQNLDLGCHTPFGYMYPVDASGVWVWTGGDTSTHLTPHLDPDFFRPPPESLDETPNGWGYSFTQSCQWQDVALFGNNWMFDGLTGGWWRIDDPSVRTIHKWTPDWKGRWVYGAPSGFRDLDDPVMYQYDATKKANSYVWTSHPITNQIDRAGMIREVVVCARGRGQVKVHIITEQGVSEPQQAEFDDPDRVTSVRLNFGHHGDYSQVRVTAFGLSETDPAPDIHELRLEIRPREKVAR